MVLSLLSGDFTEHCSSAGDAHINRVFCKTRAHGNFFTTVTWNHFHFQHRSIGLQQLSKELDNFFITQRFLNSESRSPF